MRGSLSVLILLGATLFALPARACPACAEGIRAQVRAGILDEGFAQNLGRMALPFGVLAGVVLAIRLGLRSPRRSRHEGS